MPGKPIKLLSTNNVNLDFTEKAMTAYGGFGVFAKFLENLQFREAVEAAIPFVETSPNSTGVFTKVIRFGLTVLAGGKRFSHTMFLGDSLEIYEAEFGLKRMTKSITSVTRFFAKFNTMKIVEEFNSKIWDFSCNKLFTLSKIKEDYLSFDSTVLTRYGEQECVEIGYNPKKRGRASHHPILAFLNRNRFILNIWNRPGSTSSGNGIIEFAKQSFFRIGNVIKILGVMADSGFYEEDFLKYLEEKLTEYVIAAKLYSTLQKKIAAISNWIIVADNIEISEFEFCHDNWDKRRRYIVVRQKITTENTKPPGRQLKLFEEDEVLNKYRYGVFVTSSDKPAIDIWRIYRLRAADEGVIKEFKYDFGLEGFCLDEFYPTEAAMTFRALFYNLMEIFSQRFLSEEESTMTLQTLRMKYFMIPAVLGRDGKNIVLRMAVRSLKLKAKIRWIIEQIDKVVPIALHLEGSK